MLKKKLTLDRMLLVIDKLGEEPDEPYLFVKAHDEEADIVFSGSILECLQWYSDNFVGLTDEQRDSIWTHMMSEADYENLNISTLEW